jgi:hypothetical protein
VGAILDPIERTVRSALSFLVLTLITGSPPGEELRSEAIEVPELGVTVGMLFSFQGLASALQTVCPQANPGFFATTE